MVNKCTQHELNARQRAFVEAVASPTTAGSIPEKAKAVGYTPHYAYVLLRKPHVAEAVEKAVNEYIRCLRARTARILDVIATKAESGDLKAAQVYLEAVGVLAGRGIRIANNVTANASAPSDESLEARIARLSRLTDENSDEGRAARVERVRSARGPIGDRLAAIENGDDDGSSA
jgi:hypothetical protein